MPFAAATVHGARRGSRVRTPSIPSTATVRGVMMFVDPESSEGAWLSTSPRADVTAVPETQLDSIATELRTFAERPGESTDIAALVRRYIQAVKPGPAPTRRLDARVTTVLDAIRASDDCQCRWIRRLAVASEGTIAAAAHAADFADAAHLMRTFYQMFGMAPSALMRGDFVEIPSLFSPLPGDARSRRFPRPAE
jgi:AraC-like DNA-binding protein